MIRFTSDEYDYVLFIAKKFTFCCLPGSFSDCDKCHFTMTENLQGYNANPQKNSYRIRTIK
jgi:hypothetical protein